ncbi:MAG: 3-deoxy-manno-octulosonate cytidylyltransferase [Bacteroidales bacterium]|nr:3-deoxy-manno-octulosonate cytidylyltransferase [Bacteroidales bacterium]
MKILAVIPSRYASTRFPGKPLALLGGKPIVQWAWEGVSVVKMIDDVIVATDDQRIVDACTSFGAKVMLTSSEHRSGTDRCGEVARSLAAEGKHFDLVLNVQGDEPFVDARQLELLLERFENPNTCIATLKTRILTVADLQSANNVKVVCNGVGKALYFSRQPIPFVRGVDAECWLERVDFFKHVGIYAFTSNALAQVCALQPSTLEQSESLEQLRWLEAGIDIDVIETDRSNIGIDTEEDLAHAQRLLQVAQDGGNGMGSIQTRKYDKI